MSKNSQVSPKKEVSNGGAVVSTGEALPELQGAAASPSAGQQQAQPSLRILGQYLKDSQL